MRVSAAPFAGHASGGLPAAAHVRDSELRGGHLGHAAKAYYLQLKEGRDSFSGLRRAQGPLYPNETDIVSSTSYVRKVPQAEVKQTQSLKLDGGLRGEIDRLASRVAELRA